MIPRGVQVYEATEPDAEVVAAVQRLVPQLSTSAATPTPGEVAELCEAGATTLLLARLDGGIVGMLILVLFRLPTGMRAWIEDVVVESGVRGRGVGEALTREALSRARAAGAVTVDLTSRPSRTAAVRLYERLGFERRETGVYRHHGGEHSVDRGAAGGGGPAGEDDRDRAVDGGDDGSGDGDGVDRGGEGGASRAAGAGDAGAGAHGAGQEGEA